MSTERTFYKSRDRRNNPARTHFKEWKNWFRGEYEDPPAPDLEFLVLLGDTEAYEPSIDEVMKTIKNAMNVTDQPRSSIQTTLRPKLDALANEVDSWSPEKLAEARARATTLGDRIAAWSAARETVTVTVPASGVITDRDLKPSEGGSS